jgi:hypothetical protein
MAVDAAGKLFLTSVTRPGEWMTFEQACSVAWANRELVTTHVDKKGRTVTKTGLDIGFIINEGDPLACIDLDIQDAVSHPDEPELWTPISEFDRYEKIYQWFDSYTERSRSGKGLHIWVEGSIGRGYKRDGVEVYSQERFIICTGNVLVDKPVAKRHDMLSNMVSQMRAQHAPKDFRLEELEPEEDDLNILQRAVEASNSEKFCALYEGKWQDLGFPSQSEADLALMSMFTFYTDSNAQCRRLFRESKLGKREKAVKDDRYVNLTLTICRQRMEREAKIDVSGIALAVQTKADLAAEAIREAQGGAPPSGYVVQTGFGAVEQRTATPLHVPGIDAVETAPPPEVVAASLAPLSAEVVRAGESGLPWPPGFAGDIARYIYQSAPRPVKEVAVVATLGLLAGMCGKAWHIPQSGLNLYIILIARSAVGKEAMHSGISSLIKACVPKCPNFHNFIDFMEYASGPALTKACAGNSSFVNVSGEWGRRLKRLAAEDGRDGPLQTLRTQMTNLYQKSGPQAIVGGIGYSSQDNNVASVSGVSYSLIGETTPGTFYEALTESMMEDGFLSRFLVIEYDGIRPEPNHNAITAPSDGLRDAIIAIAVQASKLINMNASQQLGRTGEAGSIMNAFEQECDKNINSTNDESRRQMWNRASLKSLRIAALLAVADNCFNPVINREHIDWAISVVRRDIDIMRKRLDGGDVGSSDTARERKLMAVIKDYVVKGPSSGYNIPEAMRDNSIVPRSYLQVRTTRAAAFYNHRLGANKSLEDTIQACIASGYLMDVQKDKLADAYNYHGKAYRVLKVPDYEAMSKE